MNAFDVVNQFEEALADYTGALYAVTTDSCTNAIFLCLQYQHIITKSISIPGKTYVSVANMIIHCGGNIKFDDRKWEGAYEIMGADIVDSAMCMYKHMWMDKFNARFTCLSFHAQKHLPIGRGGAILTDDLEAYNWLRMARYDGRSHDPGRPLAEFPGWHMYMTPEQAARGMLLLQSLPCDNDDLPNNHSDIRELRFYSHDHV